MLYMKKRKITSSKFVVCINNSKYPASLELYKIYRTVPDEDAALGEDLRIIDESGEDYLDSAEYFIPIEVPHELEQVMSIYK